MDDMDAVYRAHAQTVYKFLLAQCHDPDLAEELTQETFYQAVRSIGRFDGSCKLSVWLCQIAKHLMLPVTQLGAPAVTVPYSTAWSGFACRRCPHTPRSGFSAPPSPGLCL